jgi:hypothetical protein
MAQEGLVPISYGYKDMTLDDLKYHMDAHDLESVEFKEDFLTDMNYLCSFGL